LGEGAADGRGPPGMAAAAVAPTRAARAQDAGWGGWAAARADSAQGRGGLGWAEGEGGARDRAGPRDAGPRGVGGRGIPFLFISLFSL
jgi:hypothetical protein